IEARIITVTDAFDAMTSTRAYRRALTHEVAFAELRDKAGTQFDGPCVEALIFAIESRGERYGDGHETEIAEFATPPPVVGTGSAGLGNLEPDQQLAQESIK
ncbi:MAG: metal-dependent phosphohydrolase, partial [Acidimicrobiia bacterium]|nr:metal-dependent phosphohydrolase [Acidimicrobiia bacterium]